MYQVQRIYIRILNGCRTVTGALPRNVRNTFASLFCFILAFYWINEFAANEYKLAAPTEPQKAVFCYTIIGLLLLCYNDRALEPVRWNKPLFWSGAFFAGWMLFVRLLHPIGTGLLLYIIAILTLIPAGSIILGNRISDDGEKRSDNSALFRRLSAAFSCAALAAILLSLLLVPLSTRTGGERERYQGIIRNPNAMGMICLAAVIAAVYLLYTVSHKLPFAWITLAASFIMIFLTNSRTSLLSAVAVVVFAGLMKRNETRPVKHNRSAGRLHSQSYNLDRRRLIVMAFSMVVIVLIILLIMVPQAQAVFSDGTARGEMTEQSTLYRILNLFSSGRMYFYQYFFSQLNLLGHEIIDFRVELPNGVIALGVHNSPLEFAYRCGVPCGVAFAMVEILSLKYALKSAFDGNRSAQHADPGKVFVVLTIIAFFIESMIEMQMLPTNRNITMLYFIACMYLLAADGGNEDR